jgi:hypothetical protein
MFTQQQPTTTRSTIMAMTIDTINCPGWHLAEGDIIVYTFKSKAEAIIQGVELRKTSSAPVGVYNSAGAIVWGSRAAKASPKAAAHEAQRKANFAKAEPARKARQAAKATATAPGANGCSKGRLAKAVAKAGAEMGTGADAVVITTLDGVWAATNDAHITIRWSDWSNARAAYGAALQALKAGRA